MHIYVCARAHACEYACMYGCMDVSNMMGIHVCVCVCCVYYRPKHVTIFLLYNERCTCDVWPVHIFHSNHKFFSLILGSDPLFSVYPVAVCVALCICIMCVCICVFCIMCVCICVYMCVCVCVCMCV